MKCLGTISDCQHCAHRFHSVLCKAESGHIEIINRQKDCIYYKKGQTLFAEGSHPLGVYCINTGKIKISQTGEDGREQIVRLLRGGDILGYRAMLSGERYTTSAIALEDASCCFIPRDLFLSLLRKDVNLSFEVMRLLSDELQRAEQKLTHLAQKPVRERLAEALLFIRETYGYEGDGSTLNVRLSREEIASLVGTATESIIRLLSEFRREGIIELDGRRIQILKPDILLKAANLHD